MPSGYIPLALAQDIQLTFPGKSADLAVLGDRPLVAETPATLLDADVTPTDVHFIRNNGTIPECRPIRTLGNWSSTARSTSR